MRDMKILAIIPARGSSKGILMKNIQKLNGNPLIEYSINAAKRRYYSISHQKTMHMEAYFPLEK